MSHQWNLYSGNLAFSPRLSGGNGTKWVLSGSLAEALTPSAVNSTVGERRGGGTQCSDGRFESNFGGVSNENVDREFRFCMLIRRFSSEIHTKLSCIMLPERF